MNVYEGDIWALHSLMKKPRWRIVIPTNAGYTTRGLNVMGRGLAQDAKLLYPELPEVYGRWCIAFGEEPFYYEPGRMYLVPSKPLNVEAPNMSWAGKGSYALVQRGLRYLKKNLPKIEPETHCAVPLLGAGNADLNPKRVRALIEKTLGDDPRFTLVLYKR
jgi:hypothetical protein